MSNVLFSATGCARCKITKSVMQQQNIAYEEFEIKATIDGRNAAVLHAVQDKGIADKIVMDVRGPAALYASLTGTAIDENELKQSIDLTTRFSEYRFQTTVAPLSRENGTVGYLTPAEVGQTAQLIEATAGSKKHVYGICKAEPQTEDAEPLPDSALFRYRSAARRFMGMAEIKK